MADFDDLVRTEAYLIWEAEGRPDGQHDRHWAMACERVEARRTVEAFEAPVIPLPLKRVILSVRMKPKQRGTGPLRASA